MKLKVFKYGEGVLRERSIPVKFVSPELVALSENMLETMYAAKGVGLAAQQVGRHERMCVIDIPNGCENEEDARFNAPIAMPLKLFNPEIVARSGAVKDKEGCLSFPGIGGEIVRAQEVTVSFLDEQGLPQMFTARGFLARALQHEIDHLEGTLYIDRMTAVERLAYVAKLKRLAKENGGVR